LSKGNKAGRAEFSGSWGGATLVYEKVMAGPCGRSILVVEDGYFGSERVTFALQGGAECTTC